MLGFFIIYSLSYTWMTEVTQQKYSLFFMLYGKLYERILENFISKTFFILNSLFNMYVILVYDFGEKRVGKMLKLCRKYLNWIQNSVFEGEISEVKLKELTIKAKTIMNEDEDSIIIFSNHTGYYMNKQVVGKERMTLDNFL
jgi:CRISPR-associated protein Cas2